MKSNRTERNFLSRAVLASSVFAAPLVLAPLAIAQETSLQSEREDDEIVVTARFREERVQDIGESISVVSADDIEDAGLTDFNSMAVRIPGLNFSNGGPNRNAPRIRGVSSSVFLQDSLSAQPLISSSINEVPINSPGFNQLDIQLVDVSRVEVLKGPQGTRFGEGAAGGAIRYFMNSAELDGFGAGGGITYRSVEDGGLGFDSNVMVNVPIIEDRLGVRAGAYYRNSDGFIDNAVTGEEDYNGFDISGGRLSVVFEPNDRFSIEVFGAAEQGDIAGEYFVNAGASTINLGQTLTPSDLVVERPEPSNREENYELLGMHARYDFGAVTLESITGRFHRESTQQFYDATFTPLLPFAGNPAPAGLTGPVVLNRDVETTSFSEELRLITDFDGPLNFVLGAFYRDLEFTNDQANTADALIGSGLSFDGSNALVINVESLDQRQYSAFIDGSYHVNSWLTLLAGVRYFEETIEGSSLSGFNAPFAIFGIVTPPAANNDEVTIEAWLPRASVEVRPSEDLLFYASYARGARNGGINPAATANLYELGNGLPAGSVATFNQDEVDSYELGVKSSWLDQRMIVNFALFRSEFSDMQAFFREPIVGSALTLNGPDAEINGAELDISAEANDWLDLFVRIGYTDATFAEDNDTRSGDGPVGANPADILAGDRLAYTPEWTYNLGAQGHWPFAGGELVARIDYSNIGDFINSAEAQDELSGYGRLDLRLGYEMDSWSITAFVENAENEVPVLASSLEGLSVGTPRVVGVSLRAEY